MVFQLECKECVECYCTEMHMGVTWLAVTHAWLSRERQVTCKNDIPKDQELTIS